MEALLFCIFAANVGYDVGFSTNQCQEFRNVREAYVMTGRGRALALAAQISIHDIFNELKKCGFSGCSLEQVSQAVKDELSTWEDTDLENQRICAILDPLLTVLMLGAAE